MNALNSSFLVAAIFHTCILVTGPLSPEETRNSIRETLWYYSGVVILFLLPQYYWYNSFNAEVALQEKVPVINFSLGKGDWIVERAHVYGGKVITTVVNEKHAKSAEASGVDALLVTGHEAAAHGGDVTSLVLIPCIASKVNLPVICAGGIANGKGLLAMLSLGAEGLITYLVAMGSRFATTVESPLAENIKQAIVSRTENDTIYGKNFDGLYARVMKTDAGVEAMRSPMNPIKAVYKSFGAAKMIGLPLWKVIPGVLTQWDEMYQLSLFGAATTKLMAATIDGDLKNGVQFIGQSQGLINDIPTVDEMVQRCVNEARETHRQIGQDFLEK